MGYLTNKKGEKDVALFSPARSFLLLKNQEGLTTAPERIQRVHTRARRTAPVPETIRTFLRFGNQRLRVLLCAWDTLLPVAGPLPHI
jgi:hypothetical protein